jgi:hypothetical protein
MRLLFLTLSICLSAFCISLDAQKIPRKLINVTGKIQDTGGYYLSWSVGESVINSTSKDGYTLTQGFQQPSLINKEDLRTPDIDEVRVFPNPVRDELTIKFDVKHTRSYHIQVSSLEGRVLLVRDIEFDNTMFWPEKIDFSGFSQGIYIVRVYSDDKRIDRLFKVEKINTRR